MGVLSKTACVDAVAAYVAAHGRGGLGPAEAFVDALGSVRHARLRLEALRTHHYMREDLPKRTSDARRWALLSTRLALLSTPLGPGILSPGSTFFEGGLQKRRRGHAGGTIDWSH